MVIINTGASGVPPQAGAGPRRRQDPHCSSAMTHQPRTGGMCWSRGNSGAIHLRRPGRASIPFAGALVQHCRAERIITLGIKRESVLKRCRDSKYFGGLQKSCEPAPSRYDHRIRAPGMVHRYPERLAARTATGGLRPRRRSRPAQCGGSRRTAARPSNDPCRSSGDDAVPLCQYRVSLGGATILAAAPVPCSCWPTKTMKIIAGPFGGGSGAEPSRDRGCAGRPYFLPSGPEDRGLCAEAIGERSGETGQTRPRPGRSSSN